MKSLNHRLRLSVLVFLLIISLFIFFAIYRPLQENLESEVAESFRFLAYSKQLVFEQNLLGTRYNAASLSSRSVIRDNLADYIEGRISLEELQELTVHRYTEGVNVLDDLRTAARLTADGELVVKIGPDGSPEDYINYEEAELISRYMPEEGIVFVQSPITKGDMLLGYDLIIADLVPLVTELEEGGYEFSFTPERRDELLMEDGKITAYIYCEYLDGSMVISADESQVFSSVRSETQKVSISYFIGLLIVFLVIQFLLVRYIRSFVEEQRRLQHAALQREKEKNLLIEEMIKTEAKLKDSELSMSVTLDVMGEGLWDWNLEDNTVDHSKRWCAILGLDESHINHSIEKFIDTIHPDDRERVLKEINETINTDTQYLSEHRMLRGDGEEIWVVDRGAVIRDYEGRPTRMIGSISDITKRKRAEEGLVYLSFHDRLTGLYNRRYMEDALRRLDTERSLPFTIVMLDLNNLKLTNDTFGHGTGDRLLEETGDLLRAVFRAEDIIARIGGDEFCVLMPRTTPETAEGIKDRINTVAGLRKVGLIRLSIAVGHATKTDMTEGIDEVMRKADGNMYADKCERRTEIKKQTIRDFLEYNYTNFAGEKAHSEQTAVLAAALYEALGKPPEEVSAFRRAVELHDIGKIGVSAEILNKTEELSDEDWEIIRNHSKLSGQILRSLGEHEAYAKAIHQHHERVDGKGYPDGLSSDEICLEARVIAVADAYEAMTAERPYKKTKSREEAEQELRANAGSQFDARLVHIFIDKVLPNISDLG